MALFDPEINAKRTVYFALIYSTVHYALKTYQQPFMAAVPINLYPETNEIHLFGGQDTIPTQTFVLKGIVELTLTRPVQARQITVSFKGVVRNIAHTIHAHFEENLEENVRLWPTATYLCNDLPFVDRVTRRAFGFADGKQVIMKKQLHLLPQPGTDASTSADGVTTLPVGTSRWPFEIHIDNAHELPPSILLSHHMIHYELTAQLHLASLKEFVKMKYWETRAFSWHPPRFQRSLLSATQNTRRHSSKSTTSCASLSSASSSDVSVASPSDPTPPLSPGATTFQSDLVPENDATLYALEQQPEMLRVTKAIRVYRHSFANIDMLCRSPRVRYSGGRQGLIAYKISVPRFICTQRRTINLLCHLDPLCDMGKVASVEVFLEQKEAFTLHNDHPKDTTSTTKDIKIVHTTKISEAQYTIAPQDQQTPLEISLPLKSNHIAQDVDTLSLKITHTVRLIISFVDMTQRRMYLSFPTEMVTAPLAIAQNTQGTQSATLEGYSWAPGELDTFPGEHYPLSAETESMFGELPSYSDVLQEGPPPAAFLDDDLSHYPIPHA